MKYIIFKRNGEEIGEKLNSYESSFKDDTSANRSHLHAEPLAIHIQLPEELDEDCVVPQWMELESEQIVTLREPAEAQPEKWIKDEEETFEDPQDETWAYIPAVEAQEGLYQTIPAIFGWGLVEDQDLKTAKSIKTIDDTISSALANAKAFGNQIMDEFTRENMKMGITQDGKTSSVRKAMTEVILALTTGSLYDAIDEAKAIPEIQKDPKYITDARLISFINKIETYLGQPLSSDLE